MERAGNLRHRLEDLIERAIDMLDQIDGDADLEQSWPEGMAMMAMPFPMEDDEPDRDAEPTSIGRSIVTMNPPPRPTKRITMRRAAA